MSGMSKKCIPNVAGNIQRRIYGQVYVFFIGFLLDFSLNWLQIQVYESSVDFTWLFVYGNLVKPTTIRKSQFNERNE